MLFTFTLGFTTAYLYLNLEQVACNQEIADLKIYSLLSIRVPTGVRPCEKERWNYQFSIFSYPQI
jgi:hypothetical protein